MPASSPLPRYPPWLPPPIRVSIPPGRDKDQRKSHRREQTQYLTHPVQSHPAETASQRGQPFHIRAQQAAVLLQSQSHQRLTASVASDAISVQLFAARSFLMKNPASPLTNGINSNKTGIIISLFLNKKLNQKKDQYAHHHQQHILPRPARFATALSVCSRTAPISPPHSRSRR